MYINICKKIQKNSHTRPGSNWNQEIGNNIHSDLKEEQLLLRKSGRYKDGDLVRSHFEVERRNIRAFVPRSMSFIFSPSNIGSLPSSAQGV